MLREFGVQLEITLKCDASAAVGTVKRKGLGKVRHIDVTQLWLQEKVAHGIIKIICVKSCENRSDALTKYLAAQDIEPCLLDQSGKKKVRSEYMN